VLVTRSRDQASTLASGLRALGADAVEVPLARFARPETTTELDAALDRLGSFAWTAFSSANSVRYLLERLRARGRDARAFGACRVAALGAATAEILAEHGLRADLVPETADSAALAHAIAASGASGEVLVPQADNARPTLAATLREAGWRVTTVVAYRALPVVPEVDLAGQVLDAVTFASSATAERFVAACGEAGARGLVERGCRFYAIGPQTAATMATLGLPVAAVAEEASVSGLIAVIRKDLADVG
jgi:uroporphyrinogen III methyltransferase/synthase